VIAFVRFELSRSIKRVWIPFADLTPPQVCACPKPWHGLPA